MRKGLLSIIILISMLLSGFLPLTDAIPSTAILTGPRALTAHSPIFIDGDGQFDGAHGVSGGSGSKGDPYIIEDWIITAGSDGGIQVNYSTKYFVIRNCQITLGKYQYGFGILLYYTENGTVDNNIMSDDYGAIYLDHTNWTVISNNSIKQDGLAGIYLTSSSNNTVSGNVVHHGEWTGLIIYSDSNDNIIHDNELNNNGGYGALLWHNKNNTFFKNKVHDNTEEGIRIENEESVVNNNTVYSNANGGIHIVDFSKPTILNNKISNNSGDGIEVYNVLKGTLVKGNVLEDNRYGITVVVSDHVVIEDNTLRNNQVDGLHLANNKDILIEHNTVVGSYDGMYFEDYKTYYLNRTVRDNLVLNNSYGIEVVTLSPTTFFNNTMAGNIYNFGIEGGQMENYNQTVTSNNTVDGRPIYYLRGQKDQVVPPGAGFIGLVGCTNITVKGQTVTNESQGILVAFSDSINIEGNNNSYNGIGISLVDAKGSRVHDNKEESNDIGIAVDNYEYDGSDLIDISHNEIFNSVGGVLIVDHAVFNEVGVLLHDNDIHNNSHGVQLSDTRYHRIYNNSIHGNIWGGITLVTAERASIFNNTIYDNKDGIEVLTMSAENDIERNLVFNNTSNGISMYIEEINNVMNNFFSNARNYDGVYNKTVWSQPKTKGPNIVEGPNLGGNYWSNYTGVDNNKDGIGDTMLPYGPGDTRPLVSQPAKMTDKTQGIPIAGTNFSLNLTCRYSFGVKVIDAYYSINDGPWTIEPMNRMSGNDRDGSYQVNIKVPINATVISYTMKTQTRLGDWNELALRSISVKEFSVPVIEDLTGTPTSGDPFQFEFNITDVGAVAEANLTYHFDNNAATMVDLNVTYSKVSTNIEVPPSARVLYYAMTARDLSNNSATVNDHHDVKDNDLPVLGNASVEPKTGLTCELAINATDNWGLASMKVTYNFGQKNITASMALRKDRYSIYIQIPKNATEFHATIVANDTSGNLAKVQVDLPVQDILPPQIDDSSGVPTTGDDFNVSAKISDDVKLGACFLRYHFDNDTPLTRDFDGNYKLVVPSFARRLDYTINCSDAAHNSVEFSRSLIVKDNDLPVVTDQTLGSTKYGDTFYFKATVTDNLGVTKVYVEYWTSGAKKHVDLALSGNQYSAKIAAPGDSTKFHYIIIAQDATGNSAVTKEKIVTISQPSAGLGSSPVIIALLVILAVGILIILLLAMRNRKKKDKPEDLEEEPVKEHDEGHWAPIEGPGAAEEE